ncbi:hypothetical protein [Dyadobacter luticola]|uniref:Hypervirulence associated protein TUDOR domain-containing protein n=1 Tax=Dyadobacter luticola TaxID=1979387 RepID=A0A5R9L1T7_9BACT|nr:hypothetical protein [Dyadobacter luticola]TLV02524.1 hypothetical protein FEN17_02565 [Dyadobacter luticola]
MDEQKFKAGDWVKEKNGTTGMSVVEYSVGGSGDGGRVKVKYKNEENEEVEGEFAEDELVPL